ncbi:MAG: hypothetical protein ACSHX6_15850 [Akkermansiaceae bacterium]
MTDKQHKLDFTDYRKEAIRYWERKRIIWNLILVLPALFGYLAASEIAVGIGDPSEFGFLYVMACFFFAAMGANICYTFAYVAEFWIVGRDYEFEYRSNGRLKLFVLGCCLGIGLAFLGGRSIALIQYPV